MYIKFVSFGRATKNNLTFTNNQKLILLNSSISRYSSSILLTRSCFSLTTFQSTRSKQATTTLDLIQTAMMIGLVFSATAFLSIKLPIAANGGLVHLGSAMLFIVAILFGPKKGALAGAIGMGLFDVLGGWLLWSPITLVARGLQGYIIGKIAHGASRRGRHTGWNIVGMLVSIPVMLVVYYIGEGILYGHWLAPLASIPGNIVQNFLGVAIAIPVCLALRKVRYFR